MPSLDRAVLFFIDWFVEGKFYGTFSILFGLGFALQAERFRSSGSNFSSFWYRRMIILYLTPDAPLWGTLRSISTDLRAQWGYSELSLLEMRTSEVTAEVFSVNAL